MAVQCKCKKGHASEMDGMCRYCREETVPRSLAKKFARRKGDGISYPELQELLESKKVTI